MSHRTGSTIHPELPGNTCETRVLFALAAVTLAGVFLGGGTALGDDRDLLRESSSDPMVFIIFDTSGSMHWTPQCTQQQFDDGICDYLCESGDCAPSMDGDDPASKFTQAKEALYEVISQVEGINFGFATYNQDELRMRDKHWLYRASKITTKPDGTPNYLTLENGDLFPEVARRCTKTLAACTVDSDCSGGGTCEYEDVFGAGWTCDQGNGLDERGCWGSSTKISDMDDTWELRRVQMFSKLGRGPDFSTIPTGEFRDRFDADSYNNNDGSLTWTGPWIESDDSGGVGPTTGNARVQNGKLRLDDTPNNSGRPALARLADLSAFTTGAELAFDWEIVGDVEDEDEVRLEISSNGGVSYTTLERFRNYRNPASGSRTYDISAYVSVNTTIRFRVYNQYHGSDEQFQVDDLEIRPLATESVVYLRNNNENVRYKFIYRPVPSYFDGLLNVPNRYGNPTFAVEVEVRECTNNNDNCSSSFVDKQVLLYDFVDEFAAWDIGADRGPDGAGFFSQSSAADGEASNTCAGWDDNDDTGDDRYPDSSSDYLLRWPTDPDPPPFRFDSDGDGTKDVPDFEFGDVIPLDWLTDHKDDILGRLAPNTIGNPAATPDFSVASYFEDQRQPGESFLRLKNPSRRPLVSDGSTPLGGSIKDFREWYNGCAQGNCPGATGWEDIASLYDVDFNCRKKFLMVLTDGDNTCSGPSACTGTASLRAQTGIKTFVVAFGVRGGGNTLTCMANNGGTGDPIYPQNKQELVDALTKLFNDIKVESRAFASASVPTVQNETSDKIFLSSFTPLPDIAIWPGRLNAFRKPLPLKADNTPDFDRDCRANNLQASCHLWDAAEELRDNQAPTEADVASGSYRIGLDADERRVFYPKDNPTQKSPADMRFFVPPTADVNVDFTFDEKDMWLGLNLIDDLDASGGIDDVEIIAQATTARLDVLRVVGETLKIKNVTVTDPNGDPLNFEYVMGDIFHADPRVLGSPNNVGYFRSDLFDYQDFADKHFWRRKMLVVGANDGQLHFFDSGVRTVAFDPLLDVRVEVFTDGTGRELFSYIPRSVMPIVEKQAGGQQHVYSLDGIPATADVYIDPRFDTVNNDPPDLDEREWRTIILSGLREGGDIFRDARPVDGFVSGYFALDVTQPDRLFYPQPTTEDPDPRPYPQPGPQPPNPDPAALPNASPPLVPSCIGVNGDDQQGASGCETEQGEAFPFPAELWTFTDSVRVDMDGDGVGEIFYLDEEADFDGDGFRGNLERDLGDTWSKPIIGRIRLCDGASCDPAIEPNDIEERFVAIFGGGLDSRHPNSSLRGSWVYIIDMQDGTTLYKRYLEGSTPTAPTVLDTDRDGIFDRIYIATTQGFVYKIDLTVRTSTGDVPGFQTVNIPTESLIPGDPSKGVPGGTSVERIESSAWDPFKIFSTNGRPIYMTPTAFLVPDLDQYALAWGTGNRHNLWDFNGQEGRFYVLVDEDYDRVADALILPRTESAYFLVEATGANVETSILTENDPDERGWYIRLEANEVVITQAFSLVGVLVFTSFDPQESVDLDGDGFVDACARSGVSRAFVVNAENGDAFVDLDADTGNIERFHVQGDFTTSPYIDESTTKNPGDNSGRTAAELSPQQEELQEAIRQSLMRFFPKGCRYNKSYSLTINASRSDTGHVRYATIPIAMCAVDWREE